MTIRTVDMPADMLDGERVLYFILLQRFRNGVGPVSGHSFYGCGVPHDPINIVGTGLRLPAVQLRLHSCGQLNVVASCDEEAHLLRCNNLRTAYCGLDMSRRRTQQSINAHSQRPTTYGACKGGRATCIRCCSRYARSFDAYDCGDWNLLRRSAVTSISCDCSAVRTT
jgi:hypothetical protein